MDTTIKKPDKKSLCYLGIVLAVALLVSAGLLYYIFRTPKIEVSEEIPEVKPVERSMEEIIKSLTAPEGTAEPISEELQKSISAPSEKEEQGEVSEDIIKSLTAPE